MHIFLSIFFLRLIFFIWFHLSVVNYLTHGSISSINMMIRFSLEMITFKHILPSKLTHKCCFLHLLYAIKMVCYYYYYVLLLGLFFVWCSRISSKLLEPAVIIYHVFSCFVLSCLSPSYFEFVETHWSTNPFYEVISLVFRFSFS